MSIELANKNGDPFFNEMVGALKAKFFKYYKNIPLFLGSHYRGSKVQAGGAGNSSCFISQTFGT